MNVRRLLLFVTASFVSTISLAQTSLWSPVEPSTVRTYTDNNQQLLPQEYRLLKLNKTQASRLQSSALRQVPSQIPFNNSALFELPLPDGRSISCNLFDSPILSNELQQLYPDIKTYILTDPKTKNVTARLTISAMGISGIIFTDQGVAYIDPLGAAFPDVHLLYFIRNLKAHTPVACAVKQDFSNLRPMAPTAGDGKKRTFRIAVAATGEYTSWAGSQANALTSITTTINNVTAIYERDATISFTLVSNNSILYTNAASDPYATVSFPTNATLTSNQTALTSNIGTANFDLGIVFNKGWDGGLASVGVVCNNSFKGQGAAGLSFGTGANPTAGPQGPIFDNTVAHEMAHLFSATHTFAATNGSCAGNATAATAYEPGGGSTIMAYAGSCTGNFYQPYSDPYFHAASLAQIASYVTGGSASCASPVITGNNQPTVTIPAASYTIPASTPFTLTSTGTDADGNSLVYSWEQMDGGVTTTTAPQPTNTSGPNFRSYPPSSASSRTFPPLADILAGNSPTYEVLPSVTRTLDFRVTVRDQVAGGGSTGEANVAVNVDATAGPFTVTSQNTATNWTANGSNTATITWNVANTTAAPVNCSAVNILFSIDGGLTYPYTLLANTVNDGTETITIPNIPTSIGRIMIQSANNIFFNINTADIIITSSCSAEAATFSPSVNVSGSSGSASLDLTLAPVYGTSVAPSGQLTAGDPASSLVVIDSISGGPHQFSNVFRYDTYPFTVNKAGSYTLTLTGVFPTIMNLYAQTFDPVNPSTNFITSNARYGNVSGSVAIGSSFTVSLTPGRFYTLAVGTFSASQPTLPASYSVAVTAAPAGGGLYTGPINPGAGFNYTYVIVDNATGIIKAIDAGSDLSSSSTYPSGTFKVYGLSYSNSISLATLNGYIGGSFTTLSNDLLYNPGTLCGNLSKNVVVATITAILPVKLLPLQAYLTGSSVLLKWGTETEQNNNYFEIQRSTDGNTFDKTLGRVNGAGNSNTSINYSFTDATPGPNWNYYRVKQVDIDGKSSYTNIARINFADKHASVTTYPNPVQSMLTVDYYAQTAGDVKWILFDGKGAVVRQSIFAAQAGRNTQQINVSGLASGAYLLKTISTNEVLTSKFIKR